MITVKTFIERIITIDDIESQAFESLLGGIQDMLGVNYGDRAGQYFTSGDMASNWNGGSKHQRLKIISHYIQEEVLDIIIEIEFQE